MVHQLVARGVVLIVALEAHVRVDRRAAAQPASPRLVGATLVGALGVHRQQRAALPVRHDERLVTGGPVDEAHQLPAHEHIVARAQDSPRRVGLDFGQRRSLRSVDVDRVATHNALAVVRIDDRGHRPVIHLGQPLQLVVVHARAADSVRQPVAELVVGEGVRQAALHEGRQVALGVVRQRGRPRAGRVRDQVRCVERVVRRPACRRSARERQPLPLVVAIVIGVRRVQVIRHLRQVAGAIPR